jgi:hypothetical protein
VAAQGRAGVGVRPQLLTGPDIEQAIPYGIYDIARNTGWVNVGIDHDPSVFAVESIRRWWTARGRQDYPHASRLLITADAGGSNGHLLSGLEERVGRPGRRDRPDDHGLPFPAGDLEVEQDRAPVVLTSR